MPMAVFALHQGPFTYFFFGALVFLIFILPAFRGSAVKKARSAAFQSMGFMEVSREQAFESVKAASAIIEDLPGSLILSPVGKGSSAIGETVIFNFTPSSRDDHNISKFTVVGFRVPASVPDFEIRHVLLLDRFFDKAAAGKISPPDAPVERKIGPFKVVERPSDRPVQKNITFEDNPAFAGKYYVATSDEAIMRRMLTPDLMDALTALNDGNLNITKGKDWLFFFRYGANARSPSQYPGLMEEAVGLVGKLDLQAASPTG